MADKKRKAENAAVVTDTDTDMTMSISRGRRKTTRRGSAVGVTTEQSTEFLQTKQSLYQQYMERINEEMKEKMAKASGEDEVFMIACEYKRITRDIEALYNRQAGDLLAMGNDDCLQLGVSITADDDKKMEYAPTLVRYIPGNVIQTAAGGLHSVALLDSGEVYTFGSNDDFALGREVEEGQEHSVSQISEGFAPDDQGQIVQVSAGDSHSTFLSLEGNVYTCGAYKDVDSGMFHDVPIGQKLKSKRGFNKIPVKVQMPKKVRRIEAGLAMNAAILEDDTMVTWGMGHCGELARSRTMGAPLVTTDDGKPTFDLGKKWIGEEYEEEVAVEKTVNGVKKMVMEKEVKYRYFYDRIQQQFLTPAPPLWNTPGRKQVVDIACGEIHILVVAREAGDPNLQVFSSGMNQYGQLGHGDQEQRHELTKINFFEDKQISQVAAGGKHSLALSVTGVAVYAWGRGDYQQLGLSYERPDEGYFEKTPKQVPFPKEIGDTCIREVAAGNLISMAITDNNDVYTWGFNETASTGHPSKDGDVPRPLRVKVMRKYTKSPGAHVLNVSGGGQHTLMVVKRFS